MGAGQSRVWRGILASNTLISADDTSAFKLQFLPTSQICGAVLRDLESKVHLGKPISKYIYKYIVKMLVVGHKVKCNGSILINIRRCVRITLPLENDMLYN